MLGTKTDARRIRALSCAATRDFCVSTSVLGPTYRANYDMSKTSVYKSNSSSVDARSQTNEGFFATILYGPQLGQFQNVMHVGIPASINICRFVYS